MTSKAYLVSGHDPKDGCINYDVFSEERPTSNLRVILATVMVGEGETYGDALEHLGRIVDSMPWGEFVRANMTRSNLPTTPALQALKEAIDGV